MNCDPARRALILVEEIITSDALTQIKESMVSDTSPDRGVKLRTTSRNRNRPPFDEFWLLRYENLRKIGISIGMLAFKYCDRSRFFNGDLKIFLVLLYLEKDDKMK